MYDSKTNTGRMRVVAVVRNGVSYLFILLTSRLLDWEIH